MTLVLLTMNVGKWMQPNVEASHRAAAKRWGAQYQQITQNRVGTFTDKITELAGMTADRVCWMDGDVIVRDDAPSPFDLTPEDCIGGVKNYQRDMHGGCPKCWHAGHWTKAARRIESRATYDPGTYINGGVIVMTPRLHRDVWNVPQIAGQNVGPMVEQSILNIRIADEGWPVHLMPRDMNWMGEEAWTCKGPMKRYVYHLARIRDFRHGRDEQLRQLEWQTSTT